MFDKCIEFKQNNKTMQISTNICLYMGKLKQTWCSRPWVRAPVGSNQKLVLAATPLSTQN